MSARPTIRRSAAAALLAGALLLALIPTAAAEPPAEPPTDGPGLGDVDWAAFVGDTAPMADEPGAAAARAALRAPLTGAPPTAYHQARSIATNTWYDGCDDWENPSTPRIDLRATFMVQSTDAGGRPDQTGFLMYACRPWGIEDLGRGGITWGIDVEDEDNLEVSPVVGTGSDPDNENYPTRPGAFETGADFIVTIYPDAGQLRIAAIRTPVFEDRSTWYLTWLADAERLDAFEADGVVPTKALGNVEHFEFVWAVTDIDGRTDVFPEEYMRPESQTDRPGTDGTGQYDNPVYPNECTALTTQRLALRTADGQAGQVAAEATRQGFAVAQVMPEIDAVEVVDVEDGADAALAALPGVESVTRPGTLATQQAVVPNDGAYHAQWWPDLIDLPEAWARRSSSGGVRIALVDTGIDATWPDLAGRVDTGFDVRYNVTLPAGRSSDRDPHGTAMAGFIGAAGNNLHGIAGADWGAVLVPYRVIDVNQCIFETTVAEAILQASEDPSIRIIVIALGTPVEATILRDAVDVAQERGKLVISAVGNYGGEDDPVVYPAAYPGVVAVGATTRANERASYSSTGRHLDVVAPGGSGVRDPSGLYSQGENLLALWEQGKLRPVVGTSFAAAHVAGAAALYFGEYPHARPDDVRLALQASARDLGQFGHDRTTGYGLLDVARLLATPPPGGPVPDPATGQLPRVNHRLPNELAEAASGQRFADGAAAHAVLARGDVFVDALAGAPLTADGPLLLTSDGTLPASTLEELERVLGGPGRVYVLGGTTAVSPGVVATLEARGHEVVRLAGDTRITTAHAVAEEVRGLYGPGDTVALARADSWADAVTGGAWAAAQRIPVLVTGSDALDPTVAAALADWGVQRTVLLGGTTALSAAVAAAVPGPDRVEGPERAATAVAVAERLWGGDPDGWIVVNGWADDGWAAALAAAGIAADDGDPVLMTNRSDLPPATRAAVAASCDAAPTVRLVGDDSYIGGSVESELAEVARCAR